MKRIMCFGDSNTHGYDPVGPTRYEYDMRWTGRLAKALGEDYMVIEAGLNGMTSGFDDPDKPNRNGQRAIGYFLHANKPLDFIVVMAGTNDTKTKFHADLERIGANLENLLKLITEHEQTEQNDTKILVIAPVPMDERVAHLEDDDDMDEHSVELSRNLQPVVKAVADKLGLLFADASRWGIELSFDGCHFSKEGHKIFAENIEIEIRKYI
ncbi:MAG: arylesterase [Firmicutes bacterium]|nr:arylesterase [Bacillota bacterium]